MVKSFEQKVFFFSLVCYLNCITSPLKTVTLSLQGLWTLKLERDGLDYQKIERIFIYLWNKIAYLCKRKEVVPKRLELKQACDTDENKASDEDTMKHLGCLTKVRPCGFTCHDSRRPHN